MSDPRHFSPKVKRAAWKRCKSHCEGCTAPITASAEPNGRIAPANDPNLDALIARMLRELADLIESASPRKAMTAQLREFAREFDARTTRELPPPPSPTTVKKSGTPRPGELFAQWCCDRAKASRP